MSAQINVVIIEVTSKPPKCIKCGAKVVSILYGEPSPEGEVLIESGKMIMGGCCVTGNDPQWGCLKCNTEYWKR